MRKSMSAVGTAHYLSHQNDALIFGQQTHEIRTILEHRQQDTLFVQRLISLAIRLAIQRICWVRTSDSRSSCGMLCCIAAACCCTAIHWYTFLLPAKHTNNIQIIYMKNSLLSEWMRPQHNAFCLVHDHSIFRNQKNSTSKHRMHANELSHARERKQTHSQTHTIRSHSLSHAVEHIFSAPSLQNHRMNRHICDRKTNSFS